MTRFYWSFLAVFSGRLIRLRRFPCSSVVAAQRCAASTLAAPLTRASSLAFFSAANFTIASSSSWVTRPSVTGSTGLMLGRVPVGAVAHLVDRRLVVVPRGFSTPGASVTSRLRARTRRSRPGGPGGARPACSAAPSIRLQELGVAALLPPSSPVGRVPPDLVELFAGRPGRWRSGQRRRMSRATSPPAIPFTSSGCRPQKSAICSKVIEVLSTRPDGGRFRHQDLITPYQAPEDGARPVAASGFVNDIEPQAAEGRTQAIDSETPLAPGCQRDDVGVTETGDPSRPLWNHECGDRLRGRRGVSRAWRSSAALSAAVGRQPTRRRGGPRRGYSRLCRRRRCMRRGVIEPRSAPCACPAQVVRLQRQVALRPAPASERVTVDRLWRPAHA